MRCFQAVTILMALWLSGCLLRGKQQAKVTPPPAPLPVPAATPQKSSARPQPLSIPQTQTQLPTPQPISPEALASTQIPVKPAETETSAPASSRVPRRAAAAAGPKQDVPAAGAQLPAPEPGQAAGGAETEPRATVQEIVPPAEVKRLQDSLAARKLEVHKVLEAAQARRLSREQRGVVARIQSFLQQSEDAEKRNDWLQADALAGRALVLARDLSSASQ